MPRSYSAKRVHTDWVRVWEPASAGRPYYEIPVIAARLAWACHTGSAGKRAMHWRAYETGNVLEAWHTAGLTQSAISAANRG